MFCVNGGKEYEKIYRCGFGINIVSGAGISVSYNDADTDYEYSESLYLKNEDDELLEYLGWKWDVENNRFTFLRKSKRTGREMYKYYLTKSEYSDKISAKKS